MARNSNVRPGAVSMVNIPAAMQAAYQLTRFNNRRLGVEYAKAAQFVTIEPVLNFI
jgi:hypothetical protein